MQLSRKKKMLPNALPAVATYETVTAHVSLPEEALENLQEAVLLQAETLSPFEEGEAAIGYEVVRGAQPEHAEGELDVMVAIVPIRAIEEPWHATLKTNGWTGNVRLDLSVAGWIAGAKLRRPSLNEGVKLLAMKTDAEQLLTLLNHGVPVFIRALPADANAMDVQREAMFILTKMALMGEAAEIAEVVVFAPEGETFPMLGELIGMEPQLELLPEGDTLLQEGLHARAEAGCTMDLTPQVWLDEAKAEATKRRMILCGGILGVLWVLAALTLALLPKIYGKLADDVMARINAHQAAYKEVLNLQERVNLIGRYQDRSQSALEMLRLICTQMNEGMTFQSLTYAQGDIIKLSGITPSTDDVYSLKDKLQQDERLAEVKITRLRQDPKTRQQRFDIELLFPQQEVTQ